MNKSEKILRQMEKVQARERKQEMKKKEFSSPKNVPSCRNVKQCRVIIHISGDVYIKGNCLSMNDAINEAKKLDEIYKKNPYLYGYDPGVKKPLKVRLFGTILNVPDIISISCNDKEIWYRMFYYTKKPWKES